MDNNRKEAKDLQVYLITGIIIIIVSCVMLYNGNFLVGTIIMLFGSSFIVKFNERIKELDIDYQEKIIYNIFASNFGDNNFQYDSFSPITKDDYLKSGKQLGNKFITHDYVRATVDNIMFDFSDVLVINKANESDEDIVFSGMFIRIFTILNETSNFKIFKKTLKLPKDETFKLITTNNKEFDENFAALSTDVDNIKSVLNAQVLNKIALLERKYPDDFYISYLDNCIYLTLTSDQNIFPLKNSYSETDLQILVKELKQLNEIVQFIKMNLIS